MGFGQGVGVSVPEMMNACENLQKNAGAIQGYIDELATLKSNLSNYWEGTDSEEFQVQYNSFNEKLQELPEVINSIANWGIQTTEAYQSQESKATEAFGQIFN